MAAKKKGKKRDAEVIARLTKLGKDVSAVIKKGRDPTVPIRVRSLSNVHFNERKSII